MSGTLSRALTFCCAKESCGVFYLCLRHRQSLVLVHAIFYGNTAEFRYQVSRVSASFSTYVYPSLQRRINNLFTLDERTLNKNHHIKVMTRSRFLFRYDIFKISISIVSSATTSLFDILSYKNSSISGAAYTALLFFISYFFSFFFLLF